MKGAHSKGHAEDNCARLCSDVLSETFDQKMQPNNSCQQQALFLCDLSPNQVVCKLYSSSTYKGRRYTNEITYAVPTYSLGIAASCDNGISL